MSAAADVERLLILVPWLLERPGAHVDEIAQVFQVTAEQIRRDLALLDFCGLPGLRGGDLFDVTILNDRATIDLADELRRPLKPTASEALRLVLLVDAVRIALNDTAPALTSASTKLRQMLALPKNRLDLVTESGEEHAVRTVQAAIAKGLQLRFRYLGRVDLAPKQRHVDPVRIHIVDGSWYLEAFDHDRQDGRIFLTDRMAEIEILRTPAIHHELESLAPAYRRSADDLTVELRIQPPGRWILEHLDVLDVFTEPAGTLVATFTTNAVPHVIRLVFMAGGTVTVTKPDTLSDEIARIAADMLTLYTSGNHS